MAEPTLPAPLPITAVILCHNEAMHIARAIRSLHFVERVVVVDSGSKDDTVAIARVICPLLSGPISILGMATKEEWNGKEAQAGRDYRQVA